MLLYIYWKATKIPTAIYPYKPSLSGLKLYGNESSKKLESSYPGCKFPCWFASACASILLGVRIAAKWFFIPKVLRSILWWGELGAAARPAEYQCCVGSLSTAQNSIRNHIRPWSCSCRQGERRTLAQVVVCAAQGKAGGVLQLFQLIITFFISWRPQSASVAREVSEHSNNTNVNKPPIKECKCPARLITE